MADGPSSRTAVSGDNNSPQPEAGSFRPASPSSSEAAFNVHHDSETKDINLEREVSTMSRRPAYARARSGHKSHALNLNSYFSGPRDIQKHSKWPVLLRIHGSILPQMIMPLLIVASWATLITCVHRFLSPLSVNSILITVTGIVISLSLAFRNTTAYERYSESRRYWGQLVLACQSLGRVIWIHTKVRKGETGKKDLLTKLTVINLLVAFAISLKHKLRYEPYTSYEDLESLVSHLETFAATATREKPEIAHARERHGFFKRMGEQLGVTFAMSNPRKAIKKSKRPLGNLPLEILLYLDNYTDEVVENGQLPLVSQQNLAYNGLAMLNDVLVGTERVLTTPVPIAYTIVITQITWVYVVLLPFQLVNDFGWVTIPASMAAAYIILGLLYIGSEVENPFGDNINDLPLSGYCTQIAAELDVIASKPRRRKSEWMESADNHVLWPLSSSGWPVWMYRNEDRIRDAIRAKTELHHEADKEDLAVSEMQRSQNEKSADIEAG